MQGDTYKVVFCYDVQGEYCENVLHFITLRDSDAENVKSALASAIVADFVPNLQAIWSNATMLSRLYIRAMTPLPGVPYERLVQMFGNHDSDPVPSQAALLITAYGYPILPERSTKSRWSGLPELYQEGGLLTPGGGELAIASLADTYTEEIEAPGADPGVWLIGAWNAQLGQGHPFFYSTFRASLVTLRKRRQRPRLA